METLRAYLTPKAKKQRVADAGDIDSEMEDDVKEAVDDEHDEYGDSDNCDNPEWAKKMRRAIINEVMIVLRPINNNIEDMKRDMSNMKVEVGLAQAEAEDVTMQAGLFHGAAEEATNLAKELGSKVKDIEKSMATVTKVKDLIEESLVQQASNYDMRKQSSSSL